MENYQTTYRLCNEGELLTLYVEDIECRRRTHQHTQGTQRECVAQNWSGFNESSGLLKWCFLSAQITSSWVQTKTKQSTRQSAFRCTSTEFWSTKLTVPLSWATTLDLIGKMLHWSPFYSHVIFRQKRFFLCLATIFLWLAIIEEFEFLINKPEDTKHVPGFFISELSFSWKLFYDVWNSCFDGRGCTDHAALLMTLITPSGRNASAHIEYSVEKRVAKLHLRCEDLVEGICTSN